MELIIYCNLSFIKQFDLAYDFIDEAAIKQ